MQTDWSNEMAGFSCLFLLKPLFCLPSPHFPFSVCVHSICTHFSFSRPNQHSTLGLFLTRFLQLHGATCALVNCTPSTRTCVMSFSLHEKFTYLCDKLCLVKSEWEATLGPFSMVFVRFFLLVPLSLTQCLLLRTFGWEFITSSFQNKREFKKKLQKKKMNISINVFESWDRLVSFCLLYIFRIYCNCSGSWWNYFVYRIEKMCFIFKAKKQWMKYLCLMSE